jgi:hypothetical protein
MILQEGTKWKRIRNLHVHASVAGGMYSSWRRSSWRLNLLVNLWVDNNLVVNFWVSNKTVQRKTGFVFKAALYCCLSGLTVIIYNNFVSNYLYNVFPKRGLCMGDISFVLVLVRACVQDSWNVRRILFCDILKSSQGT